MINKVEFSPRNLTSSAGLNLLFENMRKNGLFDLIDNVLVFENESTNKIKMNHIKTMRCGHLIGIDKLERLKLLQNDPLIHEFAISIKELKTVSRFPGNFSYKTTQMLREINFKVFKTLLDWANSGPLPSTAQQRCQCRWSPGRNREKIQPQKAWQTLLPYPICFL